MRGSPPIHLLLLALAFAMVAVPLVKLTSGAGAMRAEREVVSVVEGDEGPAGVIARVKLRYTPGLKSVTLLVDGEDVIAGLSLSESPVEVDVGLPITGEGIEMLLEAEWAAGGGESAVTVEIEPEGLEAKEVTKWADEGSVSEVLFFQW